MEVKGRYIILSDIWAELESNLNTLDEVRIICAETFVLDRNIQSNGVNIAIMASYIKVTDVAFIDTSGRHGNPLNEPKAEDARRPGEDGDPGKDGNPGHSAGHIYIEACQNFDNLENLTLIANGGKGTNGQDGGNGLDGKPGQDGRDGNAQKPNSGTLSEDRGKPGEVGSSGGNGGHAGKAGIGGFPGMVSIVVKREDVSHECVIINKLGKNGICGKPGKGGEGGLGGRHGVDSVYAYHHGFEGFS